MPLTVKTFALVVALILFLLAAIGVPVGRVSLTAAGLCFFTAAQLLS